MRPRRTTFRTPLFLVLFVTPVSYHSTGSTVPLFAVWRLLSPPLAPSPAQETHEDGRPPAAALHQEVYRLVTWVAGAGRG